MQYEMQVQSTLVLTWRLSPNMCFILQNKDAFISTTIFPIELTGISRSTIEGVLW